MLGPLLVLIHINLSQNKCSKILYTDHSTFGKQIRKGENALHIFEDLIQLAKSRFVPNHIVLNDNKTNGLIFENITFNDEVDPVKFLGVNVDVNLAGIEHINALCKKVSGTIFTIRNIKNSVFQEVSITTYSDSVIKYGKL